MGENQKQVVLVVPDLMPADESKWEESAPKVLQVLLQKTEWKGYSQATGLLTPEYAFFGFDPEHTLAMQGPITASALCIEPPSNALCMHLSLVSLTEDGVVDHPGLPPDRTELATIFQTLERLQDSFLHFIQGYALDHCLVESPIQSDLSSISPAEAFGKPYKGALPQGSGDARYRQLFEDAHELLQKIDVNAIRTENGLPPINAIWPWGGGFPLAKRQMSFERGRSASYFGGDLRILGIANSLKYAHLGWEFDSQAMVNSNSETEHFLILDYGMRSAWSNTLADPERELRRIDEVIQQLIAPANELSAVLCFSIADSDHWVITDLHEGTRRGPISLVERMDRINHEPAEPLHLWFSDFLTDPDQLVWPRLLRPR